MNYQKVLILPAFPDFSAFDYSIELGGSSWKFQYFWREQLNSWFISIYDDEEQPLALGRRVSPNENLLRSRLDFPGNLIVLGDDSHRDNLGRALVVLYVET